MTRGGERAVYIYIYTHTVWSSEGLVAAVLCSFLHNYNGKTSKIHQKCGSSSVLEVFICFILVLSFWVCFRLFYNGLGAWGLIFVCLRMVLALGGVFCCVLQCFPRLWVLGE